MARLSTRHFIRDLAAQRRVLVLGGLALTLHGSTRTTQDVDLWLEPLDSVSLWADAVKNVILSADGVSAARGTSSGAFVSIGLDEIATAVAHDRFIRILGLEEPVDLFSIPRNCEREDFNEFWGRGRQLDDGTRLMDPIDLVITKLDTGREQDANDIAFLQKKIERQYEGALISCSLDECRRLLDRFATPDIAYFAATKAKNRDVCAFGKRLLNEMARDGDPYAVEFEDKLRAHERGLGALGR